MAVRAIMSVGISPRPRRNDYLCVERTALCCNTLILNTNLVLTIISKYVPIDGLIYLMFPT